MLVLQWILWLILMDVESDYSVEKRRKISAYTNQAQSDCKFFFSLSLSFSLQEDKHNVRQNENGNFEALPFISYFTYIHSKYSDVFLSIEFRLYGGKTASKQHETFKFNQTSCIKWMSLPVYVYKVHTVQWNSLM